MDEQPDATSLWPVSAHSFIQVAELWTPDASGSRLTLRSGSYGAHRDFQSVSCPMIFPAGSGLPGRVWQSGYPIVLNHFRGGSGFLRADAADRAGLVAGLGFMVGPAARREVCVLLFGGMGPHQNVLEVWQPDGIPPSLGLTSGYYGGLDAFRHLSSRMRFDAGDGLPGQVFTQEHPMLLDDLATSDGFLRAAAAETYGLKAGLGVPLLGPSDALSVWVTLSSVRTPLARVTEIWVPDTSNDTLVIKHALYNNAESMRLAGVGLCCRKGEGLPGKAWQTGAAVTFDELMLGELIRREAIAEAELQMGVAIPIFHGERLNAVVVLMS